MDAIADLSVASLARAKGFDAAWLRAVFGLADSRYFDGQSAVRFPYLDATGQLLHHKLRLSDGKARRDPKGGEYGLYGVHRLAALPAGRAVLLVEGETDVWAGAVHDVASVGVSGWANWLPAFAPMLSGRTVYLWEEPGDGGQRFVRKVAPDLPDAWVVTGGPGVKDLCELHRHDGANLQHALSARIARAVPIGSRAAEIQAAMPRPAASLTARSPRPLQSLVASDDAWAREIEQARHRPIDAVLASVGITVHGRGAERSARCPLHADGKEANPSMSVNVQKNVWRCHACGVGGDAIALVQRARGLDFRSAVRLVAS